MTISTLPVGIFQTNCYIIGTEKKNALIIDPGDNAESLLSHLKKEGLSLKLLVYTHGHYDHIGATTRLKAETGARTYLPKEDLDLFLDPGLGDDIFKSHPGYIPAPPDVLYGEGDVIELDEVRLTALHAPGHTKGSSLLMGDGILFTGDVLMAGTCGRLDLYGADKEAMAASLRRIASLEGDFQILPGHGPQTSLAREKAVNPYLGTDYDDIF